MFRSVLPLVVIPKTHLKTHVFLGVRVLSRRSTSAAKRVPFLLEPGGVTSICVTSRDQPAHAHGWQQFLSTS